MKTEIVQVICALLGSFGFSLIFHLKRDKICLASLGGGLTWFCYLMVYARVESQFMAYFWAAVFATFYAEIMARLKKAPVTIFVIPSVVPLIPGGSLYYTMEYLIQNNSEMMKKKAAETAMLALAIAMGITMVIMLLDVFFLLIRGRRMGKQKKC